jgi:aryl-alcohol dehydrogenase-like predicted oxidoreductase
MAMPKRYLGALEVSAIGLGCMGMSQSYGAADPVEAERTLHRALDLGVSFLDTANAYGSGHNEELLGRVLSGRRESYALATKFGIVRDGTRTRGIDGRPEQVALRCEESLRRLRTDRIDLYYLHRVDPKVPIEDTVGAMAQLVAAGKVRYLGLSEISARTLRRAHAVHPITAVQSEYSLWTRDPEAQVLPTCRELGVGFVPFSPLGRAMLTGTVAADDARKAGDFRADLPRFSDENFTRNRALVARLEALAAEFGCTAAQLALAWLLARGPDLVPIPGTKRVRWLEDNLRAVELALDGAICATLDDWFAPERIAGARYSAAQMQTVERD